MNGNRVSTGRSGVIRPSSDDTPFIWSFAGPLYATKRTPAYAGWSPSSVVQQQVATSRRVGKPAFSTKQRKFSRPVSTCSEIWPGSPHTLARSPLVWVTHDDTVSAPPSGQLVVRVELPPTTSVLSTATFVTWQQTQAVEGQLVAVQDIGGGRAEMDGATERRGCVAPAAPRPSASPLF